MLQVLKCYWPGNKISQRIKRQELPDTHKWKLHDIKVFAYTGTINYCLIFPPESVARAEVKLDLQTWEWEGV